MDVTEILAAIDAQISKLQQARALLAGVETAARRGPGRPKRQEASAAASPVEAPSPRATGRKLSPEGRQRIAEAMKRRWAERKKA